MATSALFKRSCPGDPEYGSWVESLKPEVIIRNTTRRTNEPEEGQQDTAGAVTTIVHTFISSQTHLLMLEKKYTVPPQDGNLDGRPLTTPVDHRLLLESGRDVSPTGRGPLNQEENIHRLCPNHPSAEERLTRWKARLVRRPYLVVDPRPHPWRKPIIE